MSTTTFSILNNKSSLSELTESSVINRQFAQLQYDGWELAGKSKPYFIDSDFYKKNGYPNPDDDKSHCGKWIIYGCKNVSKHTNNLLTNNPNPVFFKPTKHNCHRLRCSECYTREAWFRSVKITKRIRYFQQSSEFYESTDPLMETHVIVSPRVEIQDSYISIRSKVVKLLEAVGVVGGVLIVHHYRCKDFKYDKNGLHFHCVGYSSRARVRGEEVAKQFQVSRFAIVKNMGKRKSVQKTIQYLLGHCSVNPKYHTITWFGKLSYSKLSNPKATEYDIEELEKIRCCPICQERLVRLDYVGTDRPPTEIGYGKLEDWVTASKNPYSSMSRN